MEIVIALVLFINGLMAGWALHAIVSRRVGRNV